MTARLGTVVVIAKRPVAGRVKTRLTPALTPAQAADLAAAALLDTLDAVGRVPARRHLLAFDGDPAGWVPPGWDVVPQPAGGLDVRLGAAFAAAGPGPAVLVGMDTPQLHTDQLTVWDPTTHDACLGLAHDGGFWTIGFRDPSRAAAAITGVPMSTVETGSRQLDRLRVLGLRVRLLEELTDVDTVDTAREVAALAPDSRFAAALARTGAAIPVVVR